MEDWKKGDIGICINVSNFRKVSGLLPPLRLNLEYIVHDVFVCRCGGISLDVGLAAPPNGIGTRCECSITLPYTDVHWCADARFIKKKSKAETEEAIAEAVANEDYELATNLRDTINGK